MKALSKKRWSKANFTSKTGGNVELPPFGAKYRLKWTSNLFMALAPDPPEALQGIWGFLLLSKELDPLGQ
jgi:hypothetical protein